MNRFKWFAIIRKQSMITKRQGMVDQYLFCVGFRPSRITPCRIDGPDEDEHD